MHGMSVSRRSFDAIPEVASMHNGATPDGKYIVGLFTDMMDNRGKGYILDHGRFNPGGDMVGAFVDTAGRTHGFLAQWTP